MTLQCFVLTFTRECIEIRTLYHTHDGPGPITKARRRELTELTRSDLTQVLKAQKMV